MSRTTGAEQRRNEELDDRTNISRTIRTELKRREELDERTNMSRTTGQSKDKQNNKDGTKMERRTR